MITKSHFLNIILKINYKLTTLLCHHQNFLLPLPCHHHLLVRPAALLKSPLNHPCSQRRWDNQFQPLSQTVWLVFLVTPMWLSFLSLFHVHIGPKEMAFLFLDGLLPRISHLPYGIPKVYILYNALISS